MVVLLCFVEICHREVKLVLVGAGVDPRWPSME
jgi:hypothetical protein